MSKYKQNLIKETQAKANALQLGLQEPLISEFSKISDLRNICREILSNFVDLELCLKIERFNNQEEFNFNNKKEEK